MQWKNKLQNRASWHRFVKSFVGCKTDLASQLPESVQGIRGDGARGHLWPAARWPQDHAYNSGGTCWEAHWDRHYRWPLMPHLYDTTLQQPTAGEEMLRKKKYAELLQPFETRRVAVLDVLTALNPFLDYYVRCATLPPAHFSSVATNLSVTRRSPCKIRMATRSLPLPSRQ